MSEIGRRRRRRRRERRVRICLCQATRRARSPYGAGRSRASPRSPSALQARIAHRSPSDPRRCRGPRRPGHRSHRRRRPRSRSRRTSARHRRRRRGARLALGGWAARLGNGPRVHASCDSGPRARGLELDRPGVPVALQPARHRTARADRRRRPDRRRNGCRACARAQRDVAGARGTAAASVPRPDPEPCRRGARRPRGQLSRRLRGGGGDLRRRCEPVAGSDRVTR